MSEQDTREKVEFPNQGDVPFGELMDALVEAEAPADAGDSGDQPADPAPAGGGEGSAGQGDPGAGQPAADAGDAPAGGGAAAAGQPGDGAAAQHDAGGEGAPPADGGPADGGADQPAADSGAAAHTGVGPIDPSSLLPELDKLSTGVEERMTKAFQGEAFKAVREEHANYFDAIEKHPRLLVGTQVPSTTGKGMETLRDSADAKEWQDAVKSILVQEINERANVKMQEQQGFLETVHQSIDLFRKNTDLIPGTKSFNRELADRFASMAKPYEVRVDGKLQGYSIPVQPLIDQLRTQLAPKPQQTPPPAARPAQSQAQSEPPQAAVTSKAGSSAGEQEDFSTLFGTIGLPNLRI